MESILASVKDNLAVKAVVIDTDFNLNVLKLVRAQQYLKDPECRLIVGATDDMILILKDEKVIGRSVSLCA